MAVTITRTAMVDDDGTGTTGTVINNSWKQEFYGQIDTALAGVSSAPPAMSLYTPTWTTQGGAGPAIGNGTLTGMYIRVGQLVFFAIELIGGSTTVWTGGSGRWLFALPVACVSGVPAVALVGTAIDAAPAGGHAIAATIAAAFSAAHATPSTITTDVPVGPTTPFTWAAGDILRISGVYASIP